MDKNYNVDDILAEIKRRKSKEKGRPLPDDNVSAPPAHQPPPPPAREPSHPVREPSHPVREPSHPVREPSHPVREPSKTARNPMVVDEEVRSITDKARERGGRPGQSPLFKKFEFTPPSQQPPAPQNDLDKTRFNFDVKRAIDQPPESVFRTRAIPPPVSGLTATGREMNLDEIKKLDFSGLRGDSSGSYYDPDENLADSMPAGSIVDLGEYNSGSNRKDVAMDIAHTKLWLFIRTISTGLLALILLYYSICGRYEALPMPEALFPVGDTLRNYLIFCTVLTAAVAIAGSSTVGGGLISLFKMRANSDTLPALAILASIAQGVAAIINPEVVAPAALGMYFPVAAFAMFFNALGKMAMIGRIQQNFRVVSSERPKWAVQSVESDDFCHEFVNDSSRRKPVIAYSARAGFFSDFLALSFSDQYDVGVNRSVAPIGLGGALVVGTVTFFLTNSAFSAISATAAILAILATFSSTFIENIPLHKMTKKLVPQGAMVSGNKSVEDFCDTRAITLTDLDLFPKGAVSLHGIKAFARGRIDEAILDAASVICSLGGALSPVFLNMIGGSKRLLKKVDSVVFEDGMGIAAWVDSRRVLIGNRALMENHGIALPTDSYERGERPELPGYPLYLSNSGEVSARFLVDYHIDRELAAQLDLLAEKGKTLLIYSNDANVTANMLHERYGYPRELITILPARRHEEFAKMSAPRDTAVAQIVHTGNAAAFVASVIACINARASILTATVIQLAQMTAGYALVTFTAFMGGIASLSILQILGYQLLWFAAIYILQQLRQN